MLEVFSYCPQPTDPSQQSDERCGSTTQGQIHLEFVDLLNSLKVSTNSFHWIQPPLVDFPKGYVNTGQTTARDIQSSNDSLCCMSPCAFLVPKMEDEVNLKKQSPEASSAQSACFLDSSCGWLSHTGIDHTAESSQFLMHRLVSCGNRCSCSCSSWIACSTDMATLGSCVLKQRLRYHANV